MDRPVFSIHLNFTELTEGDMKGIFMTVVICRFNGITATKINSISNNDNIDNKNILVTLV